MNPSGASQTTNLDTQAMAKFTLYSIKQEMSQAYRSDLAQQLLQITRTKLNDNVKKVAASV